VTGADLGFVHRFVDEAPGGPAATLLLLHGTGGNEDDLLPLGRMLWPGAAVLSPRGKVLEGSMPRFFRRLAEGVFDVDDLIARTHELVEFVASAAKHYRRDPGHFVAVGFSNGANIAASALLLHPGLFAAAVLFRPMVPLVPDPLPDLTGTPVFIGAGRADPIVPPEQTERLAALLGACKATVTLKWQAGGHGLGTADIETARDWLSGIETRR
jgi:phospholipase/carboxylesterase/glyoxalase family protein